jgi:hypothetical protein
MNRRKLERQLAEAEAEMASILARPAPVVEEPQAAFDEGYELVMREHRRGVSLAQVCHTITRMEATNRWPDWVRGSWVAYHQLRGA